MTAHGGAPEQGSGDGPPAGDAPCPPELRALLGAWALAACTREEAGAVDRHLAGCPPCAAEGRRLREAADLLEPRRSLDIAPGLRSRVLRSCLSRRSARVPVPFWAEPYDAETARLDALLDDMAEAEWRAPVRLRWYIADTATERWTTVEGVLDHLLAVDGLPARALELPDPLGAGAPRAAVARTEARWAAARPDIARSSGAGTDGGPRESRRIWRAQSWSLVRAAAEAGGRTRLTVPYDGQPCPLSDAFVGRALACWVHAGDIAEAVDYPYEPPAGRHLRLFVDLTARRLSGALAEQRRAGRADSPGRLIPAGDCGRTVHVEVEGRGGGDWYIPLDSPAAAVTRTAARNAVARVALEDTDFCRLAAGRISPEDAAAGQEGDHRVVRDVLRATAALSRL